MNKVILIGRLTKDPDLRYTPNGVAVCRFTLAVDRPYNPQSGEKETDFIDCVVWNKAAENVAKYLVKGRQAGVEGRVQIRSYEGKDGQRHWRTEVVCNNVEFLGGGKGEGTQQKKDAVSMGAGQEVSFSDEDLPF